MIKISLRERLKLWRSERIWLLEQDIQHFEKYGIKTYDAVKSNGLHTSIWAAEYDSGEVKLTKLSNKYYNINKFEVYQEGVYICGTEGIFFKKDKEGLLSKIYGGNFCKLVVYPDVAKVKIFFENNSHYVIAKLENGKITVVDQQNEPESKDIPRYISYEIITERGNI